MLFRSVSWREPIGQLLREPRFTAAAQALAERHRGHTAARTAARLAELIAP